MKYIVHVHVFIVIGCAALANNSSREKVDGNNISDIYDGQIYKLKRQAKVLTNNTISLKHNMDGVSVFHSSCKDIWPVFLQIVELPLHMRYNTCTILCIQQAAIPISILYVCV